MGKTTTVAMVAMKYVKGHDDLEKLRPDLDDKTQRCRQKCRLLLN